MKPREIQTALDGCSEQTKEAHARAEVAASNRAATILGLCAGCWGDLVAGPGGAMTCTAADCPLGPNGGLEP